MTRGARQKPPSNIVSAEILQRIKSIRPLRFFINKQKRKGENENPLAFRRKYNQLSNYKQTKFLQKSVDHYLQLLDEHDIDEYVQVEGRLFDYLLLKSEQQKYFDSIHAPSKPKKLVPPPATEDEQIDTQNDQTDDDEDDPTWQGPASTIQRRYRKLNREAREAYAVQVKNFAANLPDRLKIDYLRYAEIVKRKSLNDSQQSINGHSDSDSPETIRRRRKSLTTLPDSLKTPTMTNGHSQHENEGKLSRSELHHLHQCIPSVLYFDEQIPEDEKPTFPTAMAKNAHLRTLFKQLSEKQKLRYIRKSIAKWTEFLQEHPHVIEQQIPSLHLLLGKTEDILLYFNSLGLPARPPNNRLLLYHHEKEEIGSQQSWSDLSQVEKDEIGQRLSTLKNQYYEQLVDFVENRLPDDYLRYEFFRNVKHAMKDYELASRSPNIEKRIRRGYGIEYYRHKMAIHNEMKQFQQIKEKLLSTELTDEQKELLEQISDLVTNLIH